MVFPPYPTTGRSYGIPIRLEGRLWITTSFPPLILKYDASSVPILQLGVNSNTLSEQDLADYAQNFIRTDLARIRGASIPLPYGGKTRTIMVDINPASLYAHQVSPVDISAAVSNEAQIIPAGTIKMGTREYFVQTNSSPGAVDEFNMLPVKTVNGSTVYMKDTLGVYGKSKAALERAVGLTLQNHNVAVDQAYKGSVSATAGSNFSQ